MDTNSSLNYWRKKVYQVLFLALLALVALTLFKLGSYLHEIVLSLAIAILISYLLGRPVNFLTKYIKVRAVSILIIYSLFIGILVFLGGYIFPILMAELNALKNALKTSVPNIQEIITSFNLFFASHNIESPLSHFDSKQVINAVVQTLTKVNYKSFGSFAGTVVLSSFNVMLYAALTMVMSFYLLLDGTKIWNIILMPIPKRFIEHAIELKSRIDRSMNAYILGQFQIASLTTAVMLLAYLFLQIPYGIVLGLTQMLEIIPLLGTWTAIIPSIAIVYFTTSPMKAIIAFAIYLFYTQVIRDQIIAPRIMGSALGFHPIFFIIGALICVKVAGIVGVILAPPILGVINEIISYYYDHNKLKVDSSYGDFDS